MEVHLRVALMLRRIFATRHRRILNGIKTEIDGLRSTDFIDSGCRRTHGCILFEWSAMGRTHRRHMPERMQDGKECRGLIAVSERWNVVLQRWMQLQSKMRGNDEIPSPLVLAGMQQSGIEIRGEENGVGKSFPHGLQDEELVIHIAAEHADSF